MPSETRAQADEDFVRRVLGVLPVPAALFQATPGGFRCAALNSGFSRRLGLRGPAVAGRPLSEVFDSSQEERALKVLSQVSSSQEPGRVTLLVPDERHDRTGLAAFDVLPVPKSSSRIGYILMLAGQAVEDVAPSLERQAREATRLRERAHRLEELERAKSEFLNLASHELRGPAATLRGYLSMLEEGTLGPLPEGLRQVLPVLQAKAGQINMLASEMIEAARLDEQGMRLNHEPVDMRQLLSQLVANVQATAPNHRLVIQDRGHASVVSGDRLRLEIVVNNLLDNAVKYSPGGGEIYCDLHPAGGMLMLAVRDNGIGIAAEDMPRLFVRFSRLAADRLPDVPGTGLGLYLARELARLHGGDIEAVSRLGEGSEFTLRLPLDDTTAA